MTSVVPGVSSKGRPVVVFGGSGQLGRALQSQLSDFDVIAPSSADVNLISPEVIHDFILRTRPSTIYNAAAFTRVDDAEREHDHALAINAIAPGAIAASARIVNARLVHVSTDYVFDGLSGAPYGVNAGTRPVNFYGSSKLAGERAVLDEHAEAIVVRTSWLHSATRPNFVATAVDRFTSGKSMQVVDDQVGTPTYAPHLASAMIRVAERQSATGILHFSDAGVASWFDVACCVLDAVRNAGRCSAEVTVRPVPSSTFPRPASRPQVSILDKHSSWDLIGGFPTHWSVGVAASTRALLDA